MRMYSAICLTSSNISAARYSSAAVKKTPAKMFSFEGPQDPARSNESASEGE